MSTKKKGELIGSRHYKYRPFTCKVIGTERNIPFVTYFKSICHAETLIRKLRANQSGWGEIVVL